MNRLQKISKLQKLAMHDDPDKQIQQNIFDALVASGLPEEMAATVVSNIGRMNMRDLWKKLKSEQPEQEEHRDPYGWKHSCGETFHQLDSPGDPCPSCGESGGDGGWDNGWTWFDEDDETHEKRSRINKVEQLLKVAGQAGVHAVENCEDYELYIEDLKAWGQELNRRLLKLGGEGLGPPAWAPPGPG